MVPRDLWNYYERALGVYRRRAYVTVHLIVRRHLHSWDHEADNHPKNQRRSHRIYHSPKKEVHPVIHLSTGVRNLSHPCLQILHRYLVCTQVVALPWALQGNFLVRCTTRHRPVRMAVVRDHTGVESRPCHSRQLYDWLLGVGSASPYMILRIFVLHVQLCRKRCLPKVCLAKPFRSIS